MTGSKNNLIEMMVVVTCCVALLAAIGIAICTVVQDTNDDTPGWATEMAGRLEEKGGTIYIFREFGDNTYSSTAVNYVSVTAGSEVIADSTGLTMKIGTTTRHVPYDRLAYVTYNS